MPSMDATTRVLNTTYQQWLEGYSDQTEEDHPILACLKSKGNIDYGGAGVHYQETVKYKRLRLEGYADMDRLEWARKNLYLTMQLEWRGLQQTDAISTKEMRQNKSMEARVKLFTDKLSQMKSDADDDLGQFLYKDGDAAGNEKKLSGFLTQTQGYVPATVGNLFADSDGSYAGISCKLGNYGGVGTNTGATRESNDPEWDFWNPIVVNAESTALGGTGWADQAPDLIGAAITHAVRGNNKKHQIDAFMCSRSNYVTLKQQLRASERIIVNPGADRSLLVSLGFKGIIMVDGVDVMVDTDIPLVDNEGKTVRAIGWNFTNTKLSLLPENTGDKMLWNDSGSFFDPDDKTYKWWCGLWGQMVFKPRYSVLISDQVT